MDAIQFLRQEHAKFRKTLKQIKSLKDENKKLKKFTTLSEDLTRHEKMEQKAWYPTLRKDKELQKIIKHLLVEEKKADKAIKKLKKMEYGLIWKMVFYKFSHDVDHHAKEEEKNLFTKVRKKFGKTELNSLCVKMKKLKARLKK